MRKLHFKNDLKSNKVRMNEVLTRLSGIYPEPKIQLNFTTPFELLVSTILSAQCTDARVNIVTEQLFKSHNSPIDFVKIQTEELEKLIFSTGFYKAKAKHIKEAAKVIIDEFNGQVPDNMESLLKLPGVGRKTANVILGHCFNIPGIVVDTHVVRISNLLGFVDTSNAEKIEFELMKLLPKKVWIDFTHYFILHGRSTCIARRPKCQECVLSDICSSSQKA